MMTFEVSVNQPEVVVNVDRPTVETTVEIPGIALGLPGPPGPAGEPGPPGVIYRGLWDSATYYVVNDIVNYGGAEWIAIADNVNLPCPDHPEAWSLFLDKGPPGSPGMTWKGAWSSATAYAAGDAVSYVGNNGIVSSWIALQAGTNHIPPEGGSDVWWDMLAQEGAQGTQGIQGVKGDPGNTGPAGSWGGPQVLRYNWKSGTTNVDPGDGYLGTSNSGSITNPGTIFADAKDFSGALVYATLSTVQPGDLMQITEVGNPLKWVLYSVTSVSGSANAYKTFVVTATDQSGDGVSFAQDTPVYLSWARRGAQGATGNTGDTGNTGPQGPPVAFFEQPNQPPEPQVAGTLWYDTDDPLLAGVFGWAKQGGAQAIPTSAVTELSGLALDAQSTSVTLVGNALRAPVSGLYQINFIITFVFNASGSRSAFLSVNGTQKMRSVGTVSTSTAGSVVGSLALPLVAGDLVTLGVYQSTGANLNTDPSTGGVSFSIAKVA